LCAVEKEPDFSVAMEPVFSPRFVDPHALQNKEVTVSQHQGVVWVTS
jgi:hypothetical protein